MNNRIIDITGKSFGRLFVIGLSHIDRTGSTSRVIWKCKCVCGKEILVRGEALKSKHTKSCGCQKSDSAANNCIDLTGMRFGRLVVLERAYKKENKTGYYWKCQCDCGNIVYPHSQSLREGKTQSCGCLQKEMMRSRSGENSSQWKGGTWSREQYGGEWTSELKEYIRNRDNRQCQYPNCTYTDVGQKQRLHVHHINRDKKNCNPYNLISLCNSHHATVEDNSSWIDYFYEITSDYEYRSGR